MTAKLRMSSLIRRTSPARRPIGLPGEGVGKEGYITFGVDTLSNSIDLVRVLSHELGYHAVEGIDGIVTNGRNLTAAGRNFDALVDSCLLSEGYAALATACVAKELLDSGLTGADQF